MERERIIHSFDDRFGWEGLTAQHLGRRLVSFGSAGPVGWAA